MQEQSKEQKEKIEVIDLSRPEVFENHKAKQLWYKQLKNSHYKTYIVDGKKIKIRVLK